jgi:hypothetical protein
MFYGLFDYPGRRPDGPWHEDETTALLSAWRQGETLEELAERHHRPIEAIIRRLRDRGESDPSRGVGLGRAAAITLQLQPAGAAGA